MSEGRTDKVFQRRDCRRWFGAAESIFAGERTGFLLALQLKADLRVAECAPVLNTDIGREFSADVIAQA